MANEGAKAGDDVGEDPLNFRPNPEALVSKVEEDAEEHGGGDGGAGVYRPPKMLPTAMEDFEEGGKSAKEKRKEKEARRRANRSALIKVRRAMVEQRNTNQCRERRFSGWLFFSFLRFFSWFSFGALLLSREESAVHFRCFSLFVHLSVRRCHSLPHSSSLWGIEATIMFSWHRENVLNLGQGTAQMP